MKNTFTFSTEAVTREVEYNRERALHYCVLECPSLWMEWKAYANIFL